MELTITSPLAAGSSMRRIASVIDTAGSLVANRSMNLGAPAQGSSSATVAELRRRIDEECSAADELEARLDVLGRDIAVLTGTATHLRRKRQLAHDPLHKGIAAAQAQLEALRAETQKIDDQLLADETKVKTYRDAQRSRAVRYTEGFELRTETEDDRRLADAVVAELQLQASLEASANAAALAAAAEAAAAAAAAAAPAAAAQSAVAATDGPRSSFKASGSTRVPAAPSAGAGPGPRPRRRVAAATDGSTAAAAAGTTTTKKSVRPRAVATTVGTTPVAAEPSAVRRVPKRKSVAATQSDLVKTTATASTAPPPRQPSPQDSYPDTARPTTDATAAAAPPPLAPAEMSASSVHFGLPPAADDGGGAGASSSTPRRKRTSRRQSSAVEGVLPSSSVPRRRRSVAPASLSESNRLEGSSAANTEPTTPLDPLLSTQEPPQQQSAPEETAAVEPPYELLDPSPTAGIPPALRYDHAAALPFFVQQTIALYEEGAVGIEDTSDRAAAQQHRSRPVAVEQRQREDLAAAVKQREESEYEALVAHRLQLLDEVTALRHKCVGVAVEQRRHQQQRGGDAPSAVVTVTDSPREREPLTTIGLLEGQPSPPLPQPTMLLEARSSVTSQATLRSSSVGVLPAAPVGIVAHGSNTNTALPSERTRAPNALHVQRQEFLRQAFDCKLDPSRRHAHVTSRGKLNPLPVTPRDATANNTTNSTAQTSRASTLASRYGASASRYM